MPLASNPANIRYNGTGRTFFQLENTTGFADLGELETLNFNQAVETEKMYSNRTAAKSAILEVENSREANLSFGLREMSNENLKMALLASAVNTDNQTASNVDAVEKTLASDLFIDLGHLNCFVTKLSGEITGSLSAGDSVTGATSGATGTIAWTETGLVELIDVSGTFEAGEKAEVDVDDYITISGIETASDIVVCDSDTPTERYVRGTDYDLDIDYGLLRKLSGGSIGESAFVSYDYPAVDISYLHGMSASSVKGKLVAVTDKDDQGPRFRFKFHSVKINLNGEFPLIGSGASILQVAASVLYDASQPSGENYYKQEIIG